MSKSDGRQDQPFHSAQKFATTPHIAVPLMSRILLLAVGSLPHHVIHLLRAPVQADPAHALSRSLTCHTAGYKISKCTAGNTGLDRKRVCCVMHHTASKNKQKHDIITSNPIQRNVVQLAVHTPTSACAFTPAAASDDSYNSVYADGTADIRSPTMGRKHMCFTFALTRHHAHLQLLECVFQTVKLLTDRAVPQVILQVKRHSDVTVLCWQTPRTLHSNMTLATAPQWGSPGETDQRCPPPELCRFARPRHSAALLGGQHID
jgi:hypothetical protein